MKDHSRGKTATLWILSLVVLTSPLFFLFTLARHPGNGRAAWFAAITIALAAKTRWELSRHPWFWTTISAIVLLHIPLVVLVPWTATWVPRFVIMPFCVVDGLAILYLIQTVEKRMSPEAT